MGAVSVVLSYKASLQQIMQPITVTVTCSKTSISVVDIRYRIPRVQQPEVISE